jgi:hypothetical protein
LSAGGQLEHPSEVNNSTTIAGRATEAVGAGDFPSAGPQAGLAAHTASANKINIPTAANVRMIFIPPG